MKFIQPQTHPMNVNSTNIALTQASTSGQSTQATKVATTLRPSEALPVNRSRDSVSYSVTGLQIDFL